MPDHTTAATASALSAAEGDAASNGAVASTIDTYVATWNETDAGRRQAGIARAWVPDARYRDPLMASDGHAGIDAMLAAVQAKFPGFVLRRTSKVDAHNGACRFTWSLGPAAGPSVVEGVDFCELTPDGRLVEVVGFIDKMPG
jgi:SnoaL-like domain